MPSTDSARHLIARSADSGVRLDRFVAAACPELSRTRVQELIDASQVEVDGKAARKGSLRLRGGEEPRNRDAGRRRLRGGEKITVAITPRPAMTAIAEAIPLEVLYEDQDVVAINKPAGMTVHAGAGNLSGTLVNALLGRGQALSRGGGVLRPGIVHRLDKETSGVILVAKNDATHAKLGEAFRHRAIQTKTAEME